MAIAEGMPAPAFTLTDQDNRPVSLQDFRGRDVIVYFYPKDDTPGCTKEACGFRDIWSQIEKTGAGSLAYLWTMRSRIRNSSPDTSFR